MSADDLRIRPPSPGDAPALAALMTHLGYPTDDARMAERMRALEAHPDHDSRVAEIGGRVVGTIGLMRGLGWNHDGHYARIISLVVDPSHRARGIGEALVRAAEEWARERGAAGIHLTTANRREGAHRFYERLGYAHTGRRYVKDFG